MIYKCTWVCSMCSQNFTRRSSAKRHNYNLHSGNAVIVRPFEYIIGILKGKFPPGTDPLFFRRKNLKYMRRQNADNDGVYSHDNVSWPPQNKTASRNDYDNNYNHGMPSPNSSPARPFLATSFEPFHSELLDEKQFGYSNDHLGRNSKLEELQNLLKKHYSYDDAQDALALAYAQLYNERDEDSLDKTLTHLREIDRKSKPGPY
jgi:hypothetical protein